MKEKKIKCYEITIKLLVRDEFTKEEIKEDVEKALSSISVTIEDMKVIVK